jgi:hypothetical protein
MKLDDELQKAAVHLVHPLKDIITDFGLPMRNS